MKEQKLIAAVSALIGSAVGFAGGLLFRQPEINRLHDQIKKLQANVDQLQGIVEEQNNEIELLITRYNSLGFFQFTERKELKERLEEELFGQYAVADYVNLLITCVNGDYEMDADDIKFYKGFGKILGNKVISYQEKQFVRSYVMKRHGREISALQECKPDAILQQLRSYNKEPDKKRLLF